MMTKPRINHVLHLILTLVTLGLWGFVWLTLGIISTAKGFRCVQCGTKAGRGAPGPGVQQGPPDAAMRGPVRMPEIPSGPEQPRPAPKPWETPEEQ